MKILVTGGLGYIGSHTVVELHNAGYTPVIIDNLSNCDSSFIDRIEAITGIPPHFYPIDVCDTHQLSNFFLRNSDIEAVIHFAAFKSVGESVLEPLKYYRNNLLGLIVLLEEMEKAGIRNLVFSSSCSVYGDATELPVSEETRRSTAQSPYAYTKQICEDILKDVSKSSPLNSIVLRYFNPIGAHDSGLIGEAPIGVPQNLVPYITQTAAGLRPQLTVHGSDYPTEDGTCIRDYIHVVDLAKAHIKALEKLLKKQPAKNPEIYNIGTGSGVSVLQAIQAFEKANSTKLNYTLGQRREGDVVKVWADTKLANQELNWEAERDLENMMKTAWQWQQKMDQFKK